jgi:hypothetical protein
VDEEDDSIEVDFIIGKTEDFKLADIDKLFKNPSKTCPISNLVLAGT